MIDIYNNDTGKRTHYEGTIKQCIDLCILNIESLSRIALADSDEHIRQLGGESKLLELMNGYLDLAYRLRAWDNLQTKRGTYDKGREGEQI